mgnify:CR=1 FL=1
MIILRVIEKVFLIRFMNTYRIIIIKTSLKLNIEYIVLNSFDIGYVINVGTAGGLSEKIEIGDVVIAEKIEIEEKNIEEFIDKLDRLYPSIQYVNKPMENGLGKKVVRFYDLDGNLIEVGTPM